MNKRTCISCRMSLGSTKRVVAHVPLVPGIGTAGTAVSSGTTKDSGLERPTTASYRLRIQTKVALERASSVQASSADTYTYAPLLKECVEPARSRSSSPSSMKSTDSTPVAVSGCVEPPPASTSTIYWQKVSANPLKGRARIQVRLCRQKGNTLVTMSRITSRGITA